MILGAVIAGKAIVSLALSALVGNIMAVDIIASAVLVAVVLLLVRSSVLRSSSSETDDDTAPLFGKDILSSLRAVAIPLAGCLVCQCSLGIGWAAMIFEHYSMVLQTRDSFLCVCAGALLCALCLVMVRTHIRSIVNFRYYAILACLLLLVVPWVSADLSGEAPPRTGKHGSPLGVLFFVSVGYCHHGFGEHSSESVLCRWAAYRDSQRGGMACVRVFLCRSWRRGG